MINLPLDDKMADLLSRLCDYYVFDRTEKPKDFEQEFDKLVEFLDKNFPQLETGKTVQSRL